MKMTVMAAIILGIAMNTPASARNYDCSKAGNANKAACKTGATAATKPTAKAALKAMPPPRTSEARASEPAAATTTSTRNYDCTKAGNANKSACKTASSPVARKAQSTAKVAPYDCTKFYNKMRAVCRNQGASTGTIPSNAAPAPGPVSRPTVAQRRPTTSTSVANSSSAGATAQCNDRTYSHSKVRAGACSHHGGVTRWF